MPSISQRRDDPGPAGLRLAARAVAGRRGPRGLRVRWRMVECLGVGLALFMQTGAVTVLAFTDSAGNLVPGGPRALQALTLPGYLITLALVARHPRQLLVALRRNPWVVVLLGLVVASVAWSISPSVSARRGFALIMSMLLAYLIAIRFTPRQFLVLVVLLSGVCMGLSLFLAVVVPGWAMMPDGETLRGVFNHKNVLGWNAAIATLAAGALAADRTAGMRRTAVLVLVASLACLVLSGSATGLVTAGSAGLFALFYALLARLRGAGRIVLVLLAVQATALIMMTVEPLVGAVAQGTGKDVSLTGRVPLWALVDEAILRRPLLGYGYQAFWTDGSGAAWSIWTRIGWPAPHAHNGFRDAALSIGLVGAAVLVVVILRAIRDGASLHCRYPREHWLWLNVVICVTLVMNMTESTLLGANSFLFTIFMAAVLMIALRSPPAR